MDEWSESRSLDWHVMDDPLHAGIRKLVGDLNTVYRDNSAKFAADMAPERFSWIDANDAAGNVLSFVRIDPADDSMVVCIANFAGMPHNDYRVGLPQTGHWREVLEPTPRCTEGPVSETLVTSRRSASPWHGLPSSAVLQLPPQGAIWLVPA